MRILIACMFLLFAACSEDEGAVPEEPDSDASVDATIDDAGVDADRDSGAFDLADAQTIGYVTGAGSGYCVTEGQLLDISLDVETREAVLGVAVEVDPQTNDCLDEQDDSCMIRLEQTLQLTEAQMQNLKSLLNAMPAPICEVDPNRECAPCLTERITVDVQQVSGECCGDVSPDFTRAFERTVAFLQDLVQSTIEDAWEKPSTFDELSYSASADFGTCVEEGLLLSASITRAADGSLSVEGNEALPGDPMTDDCLSNAVMGCLVETPFGPLTVDAQAQAELETALSAVPAPRCIRDENIACDPCLIEDITLDGERVTGVCCGETVEGFHSAFQAAADAIQALN